MKAVESDIYISKHGRSYRRMSLEQRADLHKKYRSRRPGWRHPLIGYLIALPLVGIAMVGSLYIQNMLGRPAFPSTLAILSILIIALFWGVGPAFFALVLSACSLEYFFLGNWHINLWQDIFQLLPFVVVGLSIALITAQRERARLQTLAAEQEMQAYAQELEALNGRLQDLDRTKDHFISIASHELKTPITTIRGQAQLILRRLSRREKDMPEAEDVAHALERISEQTGRLTVLIDELLDVSSMRAGKISLHKRNSDLSELCREVVDDQRLLSQREIQLDLPGKPVKLHVDRERIAQVLINLVGNALKYSPEEKPVEVHVARSDSNACIQVRDYGHGIAPDQQERIFESFYRTPEAESSSQRGLGLGLAISRDIVERHDGRIWCTSEVGKGSTFTVELPLR